MHLFETEFIIILGDTYASAKWFQMSRYPPVFAEWRELTTQWIIQRKMLNRDGTGKTRTWFVTYATDTEKLKTLQMSAKLAGVILTVSLL